MPDIIVNENGQKVVRIDTIIFSSKRRINWDKVEEYMKLQDDSNCFNYEGVGKI